MHKRARNLLTWHSSIALIIITRFMFLHPNCVFKQTLCLSSVPDLSIPIIGRTKDKRYQVKMSLKLPLKANLFLAALPSLSLADQEISNQNKLQHIPRAIQSLMRSILRPILGIMSECPTPLPCKLCHGYSNWKCLIKTNYENCNSVNVISKQSTHGGRANSLHRWAKRWFWVKNGLINC